MKGIVFKPFSLEKDIEIRELESSIIFTFKFSCKESIKLGMQGTGGFGPPVAPPPPPPPPVILPVLSLLYYCHWFFFFFFFQGM